MLRILRSLGHRLRDQAESASSRAEDAAHENLRIACPSPTQEDVERDAYRLRGQFLARQDRWDDLSEEVRAADKARAMTPAGMPVADLLCLGARSDVIASAEHAQSRKKTGQAPFVSGIQELEEMLSEAPMDACRTIVVAQAHIDLGRMAQRPRVGRSGRIERSEVAHAHFGRATDLLLPFAKSAEASPLFLGAMCRLKANAEDNLDGLVQQFERLISLNPMASDAMRKLGTHLSPQRNGSHDRLELEARKTAARTHQNWGAGGYTWVMLDALVQDSVAVSNLDTDFFVDGLHDILRRRTDQHTINTLAAFCAQMSGKSHWQQDAAVINASRIANCADWIVRNHMTELHPLVWAHAAAGSDARLRVSSTQSFAAAGQQHARSLIAELFRNEIADGNRIVFTDRGPVAEQFIN